LDENKKAVISFRNVNKLTTAFLNNAIGKLYSQYDDEKLKKSLALEDIKDSHIIRLQRVVSNAKNYLKNPDKMKEYINEILGEKDEK